MAINFLRIQWFFLSPFFITYFSQCHFKLYITWICRNNNGCCICSISKKVKGLLLSDASFAMAYFNLWLENDGWEAMVSSTNSQYTISFGLGILIVCYTTMLIPAFFLFYSTYGFGWLEYLRLCSQCVFIMSLYYTCTIICRNVTLGGLPAVIYLFLCLSLNDRAEFSKFSILDLSNLASFMSMKKAVLLYCISLVLLWGTAKLERHNLTGFPKNR